MWKTTVKGLLAHKLRFALTTLAVVLGVGFVAGTFVLTDTMNRTFDNLFADVSEGIDVYVRSKNRFEAQLGGSRNPFDQRLLQAVRNVEGVASAAGSVSGYAQYVDQQGEAITPGGAPTIGTSYYAEPQGALVIREGREPRTRSEVVMDAGTAAGHGFEVGDTVRVLSIRAARDYELVGIAGFGDADNLGGATLAIFELPEAQRLFDKEGRLDSIDVAAVEGVETPELIARLTEVIPDDLEAVSGSSVAEEQADSIKGFLGFFNTILLVFAGVGVFVGAFLIFNTFSITVAQRTREFGLLRAMGASGGQVTMSVVAEALIIGLLASVVGIFAGFGISAAIRALMEQFGIDLPSSELVFLPRTALVALAVGIGVTLVAALIPARRAAKIPPIAALRDSAPSTGGPSPRRVLIGVLVLGAGMILLGLGLFGDIEDPIRLVGAGAAVIFLGVATLAPIFAGPLATLIGAPVAGIRGLPGKLAQQNARRSPRRTAATAAALMIGLALVGTVSIVGASLKASTNKVIDESLKADYTVATQGATGPPVISPEVTNELYDLPEVLAVAPLRLGEFKRSDGGRYFVVATDLDAFELVADIEVSGGSLEELEEGGIFIYGQTAEDLGVEVGEDFSMEFPTELATLPVVGTFENKALLNSDYLVALRTYEQYFPDTADVQLLVKLQPGVSPEQAEQSMEGISERFPNVVIQDQAESKERSAAQVDQLLGLVNALLGLSITIALLGITNTLALSVFERTRELGLLRAVGMERSQTRTMIRWEAVIIAVIGAILGIAVGIFFGWAIVLALESEGFTELRIPGAQLIVYVVVAGIAGVLAALPPARRAARLNVLGAIATE